MASSLDEALVAGTAHTRRWQQHHLQKEKILKKKHVLAAQCATAITELDEFKGLAKYCVKNNGNVLTQTAFREAQDYDQRRLAVAVKLWHTPCVRGKLIIDNQMATTITNAILQCRPGMKPTTLEAIQLANHGKGTALNLMETALCLKRTPPWRRGANWPPHSIRLHVPSTKPTNAADAPSPDGDNDGVDPGDDTPEGKRQQLEAQSMTYDDTPVTVDHTHSQDHEDSQNKFKKRQHDDHPSEAPESYGDHSAVNQPEHKSRKFITTALLSHPGDNSATLFIIPRCEHVEVDHSQRDDNCLNHCDGATGPLAKELPVAGRFT